jgi:purine-binding chemotaxis protein CheW
MKDITKTKDELPAYFYDREEIEEIVEEIKIVCFSLENEYYGIEIEDVQEIREMPKITPVPYQPPQHLGLANLRGKAISVVDIRMALNLPRTIPESDANRLIIVKIRGKIVGMFADAVIKIFAIPIDTIETEKIGSEFTKGVCQVNQFLINILDMEAILFSKKFYTFA